MQRGGGAFGAPSDAGPSITLGTCMDYLQYEFRRFEREREGWEREKEDFKARIAQLEGDRKSQETIKYDLIRRIKMLEYALRQERLRYSKSDLQHPAPGSAAVPLSSDIRAQIESAAAEAGAPAPSEPLALKPQRSETLQRYLEMLGCSDVYALVSESHRIASFRENVLGLKSVPFPSAAPSASTLTPIASSSSSSAPSHHQQELPNVPSIIQRRASQPLSSVVAPSSAEASAQQQQQQQASNPTADQRSLEERMADPNVEMSAEELEDMVKKLRLPADSLNKMMRGGGRTASLRGSQKITKASIDSSSVPQSASIAAAAADVPEKQQQAVSAPPADSINPPSQQQQPKEDGSSAEASTPPSSFESSSSLNQTMIINQPIIKRPSPPPSQLQPHEVSPRQSRAAAPTIPSSSSSAVGSAPSSSLSTLKLSKEEINLDMPGSSNSSLSDESALAISKLSISQNADPSRSHRQYQVKATLRSHFDSVRSVSFHPSDPYLLSASEDYTVKLWGLRSLGPGAGSKKTASGPDVEPIFTYRGHTDKVYSCIFVGDHRNYCLSAGADATIRVWNIPPLDLEPYSPIGTGVAYLKSTCIGHTNAIWDLSIHPFESLVLSAAADGTARLWNVDKSSPLLQTFVPPPPPSGGRAAMGVPTSCTFLPSDSKKCLVSYTSGYLVMFDVTTGTAVWTLQTATTSVDGSSPGSEISSDPLINSIAAHPTSPLLITAHEDRTVRTFDLNSGKCASSMVAHGDAVSCVDVDPTGLTFITGGHDSSLRIWDLGSSKSCIQEFSSPHRKKWDESIHTVAYHPTKNYIASGGADANVKLFQ